MKRRISYLPNSDRYLLNFKANTLFGTSTSSSPYILDNVSGAAGAWSVRQLSSTSTQCLRVRRSNDNAETDIGFVSGELDTASLLTFVGVNSGFVAVIYDQSGFGYNLVQPSAGRQPQIVVSGSLITVNGKPAVQTSGSSISMFVSASTTYFNFLMDGSLSSFFAVYKTGTTTGTRVLFGSSASGTGNGFMFWTAYSSDSYIQAWHNGANYNFNTSFTATNAQQLVSSYLDADNATLANRAVAYKNGGTIIANNTFNYGIVAGDASGDMYVLNQSGGGTNTESFQELMLFNSQPDLTTMRSDINSYFTIY